MEMKVHVGPHELSAPQMLDAESLNRLHKANLFTFDLSAAFVMTRAKSSCFYWLFGLYPLLNRY